MPENVNTSLLSVDSFNPADDDPRETMVKVDHVSMSFNMASEQLNSLKEYAIKAMKRELFFEEFKALDDISFEVKKGDVFGIMGTNGSGKSTILKIIAGVLDPTQGACTVKGSIAPLIELGAGFDMDLSARENIYLNGALLGYSKQFIDENFDAIVEFAEIQKFLDMPMKNYSSGMVARIAFAIATIIVPDVLIVDEVLSVGDFMFQKKCEDRINELIERHGVTVLIVSHSNEQIARLCNKAIWIEKGHARLMGDATEVSRIYGALGGRTGDTEAEKEVFETLVESSSIDTVPDNCSSIVGENANAVCTKMVLQAWGRGPQEVVALACNNTHSNSIVANAVAAYFDAPVLPIERLVIPESVESYLYSSQPSTIYVFDSEALMEESLQQVRDLPWKPEVIVFSNPKSHFDFSFDVFEYGIEKGLWRDKLAVISFDDNPDAMAASPFLYQKKTPVLFLTDTGTQEQRDEVMSALEQMKQGNNDIEVVLLGAKAASYFESVQYPEYATHATVAATTSAERFVELAALIHNTSGAKSDYKVCLSPMGRWPELQSAGCFVVKTSSTLNLLDETSLDSIQNTFSYLRNNAQTIDGLVFIGDGLANSGLDARAFLLQLQNR